MNRKIAFFYHDPVQKETQENVALEADQRGYQTEFVDITKTFYTDADISVYVSHIPNIKRIFSKYSFIMLHDLGQSHHSWPNFWGYEPWHRFTAGLIPGNFWQEMCDNAKSNGQKKFLPHAGVHNIGWPKSDQVFNDKTYGEELNNVRERLHLKHDKSVLYAPAWEIDNKAEEVIEKLKDRPYNILIKQSPIHENFPTMMGTVERLRHKYEDRKDNVYMVDPEMSIMTYLGLADVLISDESSVLIEALLLEIPGIAVTDWRIPDTDPPRMAIAPYEHCIKIKKAEIKATIDKVLAGELTCNVTHRFSTLTDYKNHWFSNLGCASGAVMDTIDDLVKRFESGLQNATRPQGSNSHNNSAHSLPSLTVHDSAIDYADSSESTLLNLCSNEEFDENSTWQEFNEWELLYHLCPLRKNLFNWIDFGQEPFRFIELGAGCGALTSYLVDLENAFVTSVEGSVRRAEVIQQRCRHAKNLEIHACNLTEFPVTEPYDFVSLIGVLEYSGKYVPGDDPYEEVLSFAFKTLNENGTLLLAIENQLGHKYLAGYPEEHDGRPFEGISDYPHYQGMRTFDAATLRAKLEKVGFKAQHWFYPFPDYKMPTAVLSEAALNHDDFDPFALMEFPTQDHSCRVNPAFNERGFLQTLRNIGQVHNFMNSFLVIASKNENNKRLRLDDMLAAKFNVFRAPAFQTRTYFLGNGSSEILVKKEKFDTLKIEESSNGVLRIVKNQKYHKDFKNLQEKFLDGVLRNNLDEAWQAVSVWLKTLEEHSTQASEEKKNRFHEFCRKHLGHVIYESAHHQWISGKYLDLIFSNLLVAENDESVKLIDLEWQLQFDLPTALVFDRALFYLSETLRQNQQFLNFKMKGQDFLPEELQKRLQESDLAKSSDRNSLQLFETWFYRVVQSGSFDASLLDANENENHVAQVFQEGQKLAAENKIAEAIAQFSRVQLLQPNYAQTHNELGNCYFKQDKPELALQSFIKAVELDPTNRAAILNLSEPLKALNRQAEAIKLLTTFLKNNPEDVDAMTILAELYQETGKEDQVIEVYKEILAVDPLHQVAMTAIKNSVTKFQ